MEPIIDTETNEERELADQQMIRKAYDELIEAYKNSHHNINLDLVNKAFNFANKAHHGVRRRSGEPYMMHPLAVAMIVVKEIGLGTTSVCSALLHDVVEDTEYTVEDIENLFGKRISIIVDGLTKIAGGVFGEQASSQAENFRKLLLTISEDVRVILIKIADRLHNMRTLSSMPPAKQFKIAGETMYIYAPLAHRLGFFRIKTELEDLSFKYEHPQIFEDLSKRVEAGETNREEVYLKFITPIKTKLESMGYEFQIEKRVKTVYSIWHKMNVKHIPFEEVYDLMAVRIIYKEKPEVGEKNQAWMIYSTITSFYRPHPDRIRDWVSTPKANGYEALHLTVMGPNGQWIEVQIRSERMHEIAEHGISAHWKYKTGDHSSETELDNWLKSVKDILSNPEPSAIDFLDTFKLDLFASEIFVFTPKGEIKTIPQNATALDFAFYLHSDLGLQCIGAKVNHKLVPLSYVLKSGDQVELLTSKNRKPLPEYMDFVTTAKAKSLLKTFFRKETRNVIAKGKQIVEERFGKLGLPMDNQHVQLLLNTLKVPKRDDLFFEVGKGAVSMEHVDKKTFQKNKNGGWSSYLKMPFNAVAKVGGKVGGKVAGMVMTKKEHQPVAATEEALKGEMINRKQTLILSDDMSTSATPYKIADCCHPIPGDEVIGFVEKDGRSVILHRQNCPVADKLKANYGESIVRVEWDNKKLNSYSATVAIKGIDKQGILLKIIAVISTDYSVNIQKIDLEVKDGIFSSRFKIAVHNAGDVESLCKDLMDIKAVESVTRIEED